MNAEYIATALWIWGLGGLWIISVFRARRPPNKGGPFLPRVLRILYMIRECFFHAKCLFIGIFSYAERVQCLGEWGLVDRRRATGMYQCF